MNGKTIPFLGEHKAEEHLHFIKHAFSEIEKRMKLPKFRKGVIDEVRLESKDGMIKKTFGTAHYSWWRTNEFEVSQQKSKNMETKLTLDQMLDYCDVPQLFTARDTFETLYLCLLYDDSSEYLYTGIRISIQRLTEFLNGRYDLRYLYLHPEQNGEYFDVSFHGNEYHKKTFSETFLPEERLPAKGYYINSDDLENVVINIPKNEHSLLKKLVRKFGWTCM